MSKSQLSPIISGLITSLSHDGRGITHIRGKTTFVEGALVGEVVELEFTKRRGRFDEAKVARLVEEASGRLKAKCDFFEICGGCSLQHMDAVTQLNHKQSVLLEQLKHIGGVIPQEVLPPVQSSSWGYRRKARLGVRFVIKKQKLIIGFREKNGRYLADIDSCEVLHPSIGKNIPLLRDFLLTLEGYLNIPQLEVAVGDNATALIVRHLSPLSVEDLNRLTKFGQENNYHLYLQPGGVDTVSLLYPELEVPRLNYFLEDYQLEMLFHPTDFTQVNMDINKKLLALALQLLAPTSKDRILDLFCGIGNFTLPLARYCQSVLGVEGSELMVKRGEENAKHNHITNAFFACQNLADASSVVWKTRDFDGILLDPPRTGAWEVVQSLPAINAKRIVYVSCNPATLARDAGFLCKEGYCLAKVGVLDMFPHTSHVESIALFMKK